MSDFNMEMPAEQAPPAAEAPAEQAPPAEEAPAEQAPNEEALVEIPIGNRWSTAVWDEMMNVLSSMSNTDRATQLYYLMLEYDSAVREELNRNM